ncbi:MAG: hypothetical protein ABL921_20265 [Pirellula sp.]
MDAQLTIEQSNALNSSGGHRLTVLDPVTNRRYVIVDEQELAKLETIQSIRMGIDQLELSQGQTLNDAMDDVRKQLRLRA